MAQTEPGLPEGTDQIIDGSGTDQGATFTPDGGLEGDEERSAFSGFRSQLNEGAQTLRAQATDRVRGYAVDGKDRATNTLDDIAKAITDAAGAVDERLGAEYGDYARRAADAVQSFSESLRNKEIEDLYDEASELVRKSPAAAVGIAAAVGFALIRVIKAGTADAIETAQTGSGSRRKSSGGGSSRKA